MRNSRIFMAVLGLAAIASCTPKVQISGSVDGLSNGELAFMRVDYNVYEPLDTIKTDASGRFTYRMEVKEGQPEFVSIFHGTGKIADLLLQNGDKITVVADTLGNFTVEGSEETVLFNQNQKAYSRFLADMDAETDPKALARIYLDHYRASVKYVLEHPYSLTVIPVLYENLDYYTPVFSQNTDAIHFRRACDSLKTIYPESRYVKALERETIKREERLTMQTMLQGAQEVKYPDLDLPSINGTRISLSSIDAKVVLVHFWDPADATHKMFNIDVLKKIYEEYRTRGFEIYAVAVNPDKAQWASIVRSQDLQWVNVNDGLGTASQALRLYNVTQVPCSFIISDNGFENVAISGESALRKILKQKID